MIALKRILPFIFGVFAALPIVFPVLGLLQWISLAPLALLILKDIEGEANGRKAFFADYRRSFLFFLGFYIVSYSWFAEMYPLSVTGMPRIAAFFVVCLALLGLPAFQSLGFSLLVPIGCFVSRRNLPKGLVPILFGGLWAVFEWLQGLFWFGIPWVRLPLGQINYPELFRSVNLFGSYFVTFLIVSVSFYVAFAFKAENGKRRNVFAFAAIFIFALNGFYGLLDIGASAKTDRESIRVAALQGNISTEEKWNSQMLEQTFQIYRALALEAADKGAQYALFPETVIPFVPENDSDIEDYLRGIASEGNITLMVGTFVYKNGELGNGIRVYEPHKAGKTVYVKQRPVPFGEYVPMRDIIMAVLPVLGEINMLDRSLVPGKESTTWQDGSAEFGYLICFDSIYDSFARESAKNGAELLMISTNDSWFGDSVGTEMHLAQAVLRGAETGRSVVRAANTGISAIITPSGEAVEYLSCDTEGLICADIPLSNSTTLFVSIGNLFLAFCALFIIFAYFIKILKQKYRSFVVRDERTVFFMLKKKIISLAFAILMLLSALTSCAKDDDIPPKLDKQDGVVFTEGESIERLSALADADAPKLSDTQNKEMTENVMSSFFDIFNAAVTDGKNEGNMLVSPLSVYIALSLTATGAEGRTLEEMSEILQIDDFEDTAGYISALTERLMSYTDDKTKLGIANSVWAKDGGNMNVNEDFIDVAEKYFAAEMFKAPFDRSTLGSINSWIEDKTDGMIREMLDEIPDSAVMYLINALVFKAEWQEKYEKHQVSDRDFTAYDGTKKKTGMMLSVEDYYLCDGDATGFVKPYRGGKFSFAALLPNSGVDVYEYASGLSGDAFAELLRDKESAYVNAVLPEFKYEYKDSLKNELISMGMNTPFSIANADFSGLGQSPNGNIYINDVYHKTFIEVSPVGTKAGAATVVEMYAEGMAMPSDIKEYTVTLDRPFVYAIIDNESGLPLFLGILANP